MTYHDIVSQSIAVPTKNLNNWIQVRGNNLLDEGSTKLYYIYSQPASILLASARPSKLFFIFVLGKSQLLPMVEGEKTSR